MTVPRRTAAFLLGFALLAGAGNSAGQDKAKKPDDPAPKADKSDKADVKGYLPPYWKQLGLTDEQRLKVQKLNGRYGVEIDKLEQQIKDLKAKRDKERLEVLTADQKKRLEAIIKEKAGTDK